MNVNNFNDPEKNVFNWSNVNSYYKLHNQIDLKSRIKEFINNFRFSLLKSSDKKEINKMIDKVVGDISMLSNNQQKTIKSRVRNALFNTLKNESINNNTSSSNLSVNLLENKDFKQHFENSLPISTKNLIRFIELGIAGKTFIAISSTDKTRQDFSLARQLFEDELKLNSPKLSAIFDQLEMDESFKKQVEEARTEFSHIKNTQDLTNFFDKHGQFLRAMMQANKDLNFDLLSWDEENDLMLLVLTKFIFLMNKDEIFSLENNLDHCQSPHSQLFVRAIKRLIPFDTASIKPSLKLEKSMSYTKQTIEKENEITKQIMKIWSDSLPESRVLRQQTQLCSNLIDNCQIPYQGESVIKRLYFLAEKYAALCQPTAKQVGADEVLPSLLAILLLVENSKIKSLIDSKLFDYSHNGSLNYYKMVIQSAITYMMENK